MSRRQQLTDKLHSKNDAWMQGLLLSNIPAIMLDNDFIRPLCSACNAALVQGKSIIDEALHKFDISRNA